ncbi:MAG: ABC transporter substrate-binding protein [Candidatus Eremiobacteraeota bacterium]|nr:ABC transporter substrate-binding protein [Candidatus Eremiobacteraeota bacterium]
MQAFFRAVTLVLAASIGLAGCGGNTSTNTASNTASGDASGAPLVVARVKDAVVLDPAQAVDGNSLNLTQEIMRGLVQFKIGTFDIEPAIAQKWDMNADGVHWTFSLKPNLKFSDGTQIDAKAVKFNFDRWRLTKNPYHSTLPYGYYAAMFGSFPGLIKDVTVKDPKTVVFTLTRPFSPFLHDLAMPPFAIGSPKAIAANLQGFGQAPVGYGPYTLAEWVKDDHITLKANPSWQGQKVSYDTVIIRDIPDQATSVLEMQKGDIDFLVDPRPDDAKTLAKQTGITLYQQPSNNNSYVAMNVDKAPFGDVDVRRAVAYALDVPGIVKAFYNEGAVVANNWTPPGMLGDNPAVKTYPHDPAKAKQLLAKAGMASGFSVDLLYPTTPRPYMPEPQRIAETIQAELKAVGINVTLQPYEFGVFLDKVRHGEHAMCLIGWSGDNGDPDNFLYPLLDKDSADAKPNGQNYAFWRDEKFHQLMLAGQRTLDESKRGAIYAQANARISDQVPAIPIVHTMVPIAVKSAIRGFHPSPDTHIAFEYLSVKR